MVFVVDWVEGGGVNIYFKENLFDSFKNVMLDIVLSSEGLLKGLK